MHKKSVIIVTSPERERKAPHSNQVLHKSAVERARIPGCKTENAASAAQIIGRETIIEIRRRWRIEVGVRDAHSKIFRHNEALYVSTAAKIVAPPSPVHSIGNGDRAQMSCLRRRHRSIESAREQLRSGRA